MQTTQLTECDLNKVLLWEISKIIIFYLFTAKKTVRPSDSNSIIERTSDLVNDSQVS